MGGYVGLDVMRGFFVLCGFANVPMATDYSWRRPCRGILKFYPCWRTLFEFCCNKICSTPETMVDGRSEVI